MNAEDLISRLDKVKPSRSKPRHWIARCPAHEDKSPSLAIREMDDGRILLKCFCGCPTSDVLAALGLEFSDLYPEPLPEA
jgi:DNA primase